MEDEKKQTKKVSKKLIAKKNHEIHFNEHHIVIKKGEEVKVPKMFIETLKVEQVI